VPNQPETKLRYGATVETEEVDLFFVEAVWPCTCGKRKCSAHRGKFSRYNVLAFNDRRHPNTDYDGYGSCRGTFDAQNKDVANVRSRIERRLPNSPRESVPVFSDVHAAWAYAQRLMEYGELASKYDNMTHIEHWRERHEGVIKTRVVHERSARIVQVVKAIVTSSKIAA
jgi:hypothetical protein